MSILALCLFVLFALVVLPYMLCLSLRFLLWKFGLRITASGPFSYSDIMLNVPVKLNYNILIRVRRLRLRVLPAQKMFSLQVEGLQVYLTLKNQFSEWQRNKVQLLHMVEELKNVLSRKGAFKGTDLADAVRLPAYGPPGV